MVSVSVLVWKIEPSDSSSSRIAPALTRLPLWAMAIGPRWCRKSNGCALEEFESPAVE
jgi:hypothetical protein